MKVLSNKETCKSTNISGTAARRVPVLIHWQKLYSYDWRNLRQTWLGNRQQTSTILLGGGHLWAMISSVWQIITMIYKKNWIQSMISLHLFFFHPLAKAVLPWAQPICLRQQELKLPSKPIWKGPTMPSISCCVHASEGICRDVCLM